MRLTLAALLMAHGVIVALQSIGCFGRSTALANPAWLYWWPTKLGQSWLLAALRLEGTPLVLANGAMWLVGGLALLAAGFGLLGIAVPHAWWRDLAVGGASLSLIMLLIYAHPLFIVGASVSTAVLLALVWADWSPLVRL